MSSTAWNHDSIREYARTLGQDSFGPVPRAVRSVSRMMDVFHFHAYAARDALSGFVNEGEQPTEEHLQLVFGVSERQQDFAYARLASEAHLLSTLLATRSLYDIFSQIVNELLLSPKLKARDCTIAEVAKRLPAGRLRDELDKLLASDWYRYVSGFVNLSKHRYMIQHGVHAYLQDNKMVVQVGAFDYGADKWAAKSATQVLEGAFEVKNSLMTCGRAMNAECGIPE